MSAYGRWKNDDLTVCLYAVVEGKGGVQGFPSLRASRGQGETVMLSMAGVGCKLWLGCICA